MKRLMFAFVACLTVCAGAEETAKMMMGPDGQMHPVKHLPPGKLQEMKNRRTGGMLVKPGSQQGKIVYVNAQTLAPTAWIEKSAADFKRVTKIATSVETGTFSFPQPKLAGEATLFVVDDPSLPSLLAAPENKWVMVNVASLKAGDGAKETFFLARVQKALTRGFCLLVGSQTSNYPNSLMGCVTKPQDLDQFVDCRLPVDIPLRFKGYVCGYGITPGEEVTYRLACQEGWAPAPTNEFQKAIWDKVHAMPTTPLKIAPETKRVTE